jgi:hypothetical protein
VTGTGGSGTSVNIGIDPVATNLTSSSEQIYDLRMGFIGTRHIDSSGVPYYALGFGHDAVVDENHLITSSDIAATSYSGAGWNFLTVPQDNMLKLDLTKVDLFNSSKQLNFFIKFDNIDVDANGALSTTEKCNAMAELKFAISSSGITKEYKALLNQGTICASGITSSKLMGATSNGTSGSTGFYLTVNNLKDIITLNGDTYSSGTIFDNITFSVKPLYLNAPAGRHFDASIGLQMSGCTTGSCTNHTTVLPGPFTYVASTGYFGGTSRKIEANIDRQNGTLYDLYDYVLFNGS